MRTRDVINKPAFQRQALAGATGTVDTLSIVPDEAHMEIGETIPFAVSGSLGGQIRHVSPAFSLLPMPGAPYGALSGATFTALSPGVARIFADTGVTNAMNTVHVKDTISPADVTDMTAFSLDATRIRLTFTAVADDGNTGNAASLYEFHVATTPLPDDTTCRAAPVVHSGSQPKAPGLTENRDIEGLSPATTVHFCLIVYDGSGNRSSWSGNVSASTMTAPDTTPPADITGATATPVSASEVRLDFTASGEDGNAGSASGYDIRKSLDPVSTDADCDGASVLPNAITPVAAGTPISYFAKFLSDGIEVHFCIRAIDSAGNKGKWSGTLRATTPVTNAAPIVDLGGNAIFDMADVVLTLTPVAAYDPDDGVCNTDPANYVHQWELISKPPTSHVTNANLTGSATLTVAFTPDQPGAYTLRLYFTDEPGICDGGSKIGYDTVTVNVTDSVPSVSAVLGRTLIGGVFPQTTLTIGSDLAGAFTLRLSGDCSTGTVLAGPAPIAGGTSVSVDLFATNLAAGMNALTACVVKASGSTGLRMIEIYRDNTTPGTVALPGGTTSSVAIQVTLECADDARDYRAGQPDSANYGCAQTLYTLDGNDPLSGVSNTYLGPISLPDQTTTTVKFLSVDGAGNWEEAVRTETYTIDSSVPTITVIENQYFKEHHNGQPVGYRLSWLTDRPGLPFAIRIGGADCASGVLSAGTQGFGVTTTSIVYSTLARTQLTHGQTYTVRVCVENLAGDFGNYSFSMTACNEGTHSVSGVCVSSTRTETVHNGTRVSEWNSFANLWSEWDYQCNWNCEAEGGRCPEEYVYVNESDGTKRRYCHKDEKFVIDYFTNCEGNGCYVGRWFDVQFLLHPSEGEQFKWEWLNRPSIVGFDTILEADGYLHGPSGGCGFLPPLALCWGRMPDCYLYTFKVTDMSATVTLEDGMMTGYPFIEKSLNLCTSW